MKMRRRIPIIFIAAIAAVFVLSQAAAFALPYVAATPYVVTFQGPAASNVSCEIIKSFSGSALQQLQIKNTGNVPENVRLRVSGSWINSDGITVAAWNDDLPVSAGWTKDGGYYAYSGVLMPGETTASLIASYEPEHREDGSHLELSFTALAEEAVANRD